MSIGGTFFGMNTALRGLQAQQAALEVTGHNISNLNTDGYTRQRAEMVASPPWASPSWGTPTSPGQLGTGVNVESIERLRDGYVDRNVRQQLGNQSQQQTFVEQLGQLEGVMGEPGSTGLSAKLSKFFTSLADVAQHPDDLAARQSFAQSANSLTVGLNQLSTNFTDIQTQSDVRLNDTVTQVNTITSQINALNVQIRDAIRGGLQPNDLLDRRDQALDQLSGLVNFTYSETPGTLEVTATFGTATPITLVDGTLNTTTPITRGDLDTAYTNGDLSSGRAYADENLFTTRIPALLTQLNDLAASIVNGVNTQNTAGFDLNGTAGGNIFDATATTAAAIRLDPANDIRTNPRLVAAASSWALPGEPGNGGNALALGALRSVIQGAPLNGTWEGFYGSFVAGLGGQSQAAQQSSSHADLLTDMATGRRTSTSGVSLDEEMTNMLRFQNAYNASARMMTTIDESIDILINRMGRVGL